MNVTLRFSISILMLCLLTGFGWFKNDRSVADEQRDIRVIRSEVLDMLYSEVPESRGRIRDAVGYAVFSNVGLNLLVLATASYLVDDKLN